MASSEIEYDVYGSPRMGVIQFGDYVAADGSEKESILRASKYFKRTHRARAHHARDAITDYLTAPIPKIASIEYALFEAENAAHDSSSSESKIKDAEASVETLQAFTGINLFNQGWFASRDLVPVADDQLPLDFGGVAITAKLACLVRSASKTGVDQVGAILLNTQKGKGIGSKPETQTKRKRAGEAASLIVLRTLIDRHSDLGEPLPKDTLHIYVRAQHIWPAPKAFAQKLANLEADARSVAERWEFVKAPDDFNADLAKFHP